MAELIETAEEATPEWFTPVLQANGHDVHVTAVSAEPVGTGQMAESSRFHLRYDSETDAPSTLIGKFPALDEASRAAGAHGGYAKEVRFYQNIASTVKVATPNCHLALLGEDNVAFTLLLDDLAPAEQGDQIAGCSVDEAEVAARNAAGLHGPRWNDQSLFELEGMTRLDDTDSIDFLSMLVSQFTPGFIERYQAHLSHDDAAMLTMFADRIGTWLARDLPGFGLVHGDYRLDNLLFAPPSLVGGAAADGAPPVYAVDWQTISVGAPVNDLSYFLGNGLVRDVRREAERDIVGTYHQELQSHGVDLSFEAVFEEYRWGTFHGPLITILGAMMVVQTTRGDEMFMAMISRSLDQIRDLNAADLLAQ